MSWEVTLEGRSDPGGVVLLINDRREAESIASEIRRKGIPVVVRPQETRRRSVAPEGRASA